MFLLPAVAVLLVLAGVGALLIRLFVGIRTPS
jgi:hypothetical protein